MLGRRFMRTAVVAGAVAMALAALPTPGRADIHTQGVGVATAGAAVAEPGLSETAQVQTMSLDFDAAGAAYFVPMVSPLTEWDCRHDEATEGDRLPDERDGFVLTSLEQGETTSVGAGMLRGRCVGRSTTTPGDEIVIACPSYLFVAYARVGSVIQAAGTCMYTWTWQYTVGDFTMTAKIEPTSPDNTTFTLSAVAFRFRS